MFVKDLKCCKFFDKYALPYTGMLEPLFCKVCWQNVTSNDLFKCLRFDVPKSFNESQAKECFEEYVKGSTKLSQLLAFCMSYTIMPFNDLSGAINVKYLQDTKDDSIMKSSACLKILFLSVIYSDKFKYFRMIYVALECESQGYANPQITGVVVIMSYTMILNRKNIKKKFNC